MALDNSLFETFNFIKVIRDLVQQQFKLNWSVYKSKRNEFQF